jgi:hypothetical protein
MMHTVALAPSERPLAATTSSRSTWIGRIVSGLALLFLAFDSTLKLVMPAMAAQATPELGFTEHTVFIVGAIEAVCFVLYLVPRTSVLGALLWVGYLGGAVATHVRAGSPVLTHTLFPLVIAALLGVGLWLRDARLRRIVDTAFEPVDRSSAHLRWR